mmetsp:Transcript_28690/g.64102  ORF Transcript_28690/g.64102 Transcript_28690/m.64102 type:complete len:278 (-) Transcript_28690:219-1052(-)
MIEASKARWKPWGQSRPKRLHRGQAKGVRAKAAPTQSQTPWVAKAIAGNARPKLGACPRRQYLKSPTPQCFACTSAYADRPDNRKLRPPSHEGSPWVCRPESRSKPASPAFDLSSGGSSPAEPHHGGRPEASLLGFEAKPCGWFGSRPFKAPPRVHRVRCAAKSTRALGASTRSKSSPVRPSRAKESHPLRLSTPGGALGGVCSHSHTSLFCTDDDCPALRPELPGSIELPGSKSGSKKSTFKAPLERAADARAKQMDPYTNRPRPSSQRPLKVRAA